MRSERKREMNVWGYKNERKGKKTGKGRVGIVEFRIKREQMKERSVGK